MFGKWIDEIRRNTKGMDRKKKAQYIAEYYWAHFLILFLAAGTVLLLFYNFTLGKKKVSFECAIVNAATDDARDEKMESGIARMLGLKTKEVRVDSAYQVSFANESGQKNPVKVEKNSAGGTDYSGYDKFFFAWGNRELDAVIMPKSFLAYCEQLGGELNTIGESGEKNYLLLSKTKLKACVTETKDDPWVIVFPKDARHEAKASVFCEKINK